MDREAAATRRSRALHDQSPPRLPGSGTLARGELTSGLRNVCAAIPPAVLVGGTVLLILRRLTGALVAPLATVELVILGLALSALALATWAYLGRRTVTTGGWRSMVSWAPWGAAAAAAGAVSLPGSSIVGLLLLWGTLVAAAIGSRTGFVGALELGVGSLGSGPRRESLRTARHISAPDGARRLRDARVSQELIRFERQQQELIRGRITTVVGKGARVAAVHVAFCPPFVELPRVQIAAAGLPRGGAVAAAQILPHGARFEVKLPQRANQPTQVVIRFVASSPREDDRA